MAPLVDSKSASLDVSAMAPSDGKRLAPEVKASAPMVDWVTSQE